MKIGLGICTYNRPEMLHKSARAIERLCAPVVDEIIVYDDGSSDKYNGAYKRSWAPLKAIGAHVVDAPQNCGVAYAKNRIFDYLISKDCDWIVVAEDDLKPLGPEAITEYVRIAESRGEHHYSYALHGPANLSGPVDTDDEVAYYPHSVGAWCLYSRECLENVGLFDQQMVNAFEHVEWELRAYTLGYLPNGGAHRFADITKSADYLMELPNSIEKSSIRPRPDWHSNIRNSLTYWRDSKPDTFNLLFGEGLPLYNYAQGIIGQ